MSDCCSRLHESEYEFFLSLRSAVRPHETPLKAAAIMHHVVSRESPCLAAGFSSQGRPLALCAAPAAALAAFCLPARRASPRSASPQVPAACLRHAGSPVGLALGPGCGFGGRQQLLVPNPEAAFCPSLPSSCVAGLAAEEVMERCVRRVRGPGEHGEDALPLLRGSLAAERSYAGGSPAEGM